MFLLDSLMIAGIRWTLETVVTAAEAEMNDDTRLREQLLEAEMQRELGAIDEPAFREIEADLLARIRAIRQRREGGAGPLAFTAGTPLDSASGATFDVEASVAGDFHDPAPVPVPDPVRERPAIAARPPQSRGRRRPQARAARRPRP